MRREVDDYLTQKRAVNSVIMCRISKLIAVEVGDLPQKSVVKWGRA